MADIVNLNRVRKKKRAAEKESDAAANRAKFGRTKPDRKRAKAEKELQSRKLTGHLRTDGDADV